MKNKFLFRLAIWFVVFVALLYIGYLLVRWQPNSILLEIGQAILLLGACMFFEVSIIPLIADKKENDRDEYPPTVPETPRAKANE